MTRIPNPLAPRTLLIELLVFFAAVALGGLVASAIGAPGWPPVAHAAVDGPPASAPPSAWDRVVHLLSKPAWIALGGALMIGAAQLLALARRRWRRLRGGLLGYVAGGVATGLLAFGAAAALSGSLDAGAMALAGAVVAAFGLARDPETGRQPQLAPGEMLPEGTMPPGLTGVPIPPPGKGTPWP